MRQPVLRSLAVSLALCAMVLRALLPDGWMPAAGAAPFVICAADGTHRDGKTPDQAPREHAPCAFAAAAPLSPPALAAAFLGAAAFAVREAILFVEPDFFYDPDHRPNAARAPPALA
ncbi:MAG TPA: hypothetical protein VGC36_03010 [Rhizomicrobium sp.]